MSEQEELSIISIPTFQENPEKNCSRKVVGGGGDSVPGLRKGSGNIGVVMREEL